MPFETGTATDIHDMLEKLETFCGTVLGWTIVDSDIPSDILQTARLIMRPIGTGSNRPFAIINSQSDGPAGRYTLSLRMAEDYDPILPFGSNAGVSEFTRTHFSQNPFTYWFYGNDRRLIVIGKIGTIYTSFYIGLFLPFALPNEYLMPWIVMGNNRLFEDINQENSRNRFIADPGQFAAHMRLRSGVWIPIANQSDSTLAEPNFISTFESGMVWPSRTNWATGSSAGSFGQTRSMPNIRPNLAGEMPLFQAHLWQRMETRGQFVGALDGVYVAPGFGRAPEQLVSFGGSDYRLFANVHRTGPQHLMAIEEI